MSSIYGSNVVPHANSQFNATPASDPSSPRRSDFSEGRKPRQRTTSLLTQVLNRTRKISSSNRQSSKSREGSPTLTTMALDSTAACHASTSSERGLNPPPYTSSSSSSSSSPPSMSSSRPRTPEHVSAPPPPPYSPFPDADTSIQQAGPSYGIQISTRNGDVSVPTLAYEYEANSAESEAQSEAQYVYAYAPSTSTSHFNKRERTVSVEMRKRRVWMGYRYVDILEPVVA